MGGGKGGGGGGQEAELARQEEQARQERIRAGTSSINSAFDQQFTEDFYNQQRDRYINYAMPQVVEQKGKAGNELLFAMDRAGQTEGSARADLAGELEKRFELQGQKVRDDALNMTNQTRSATESARADLIAMLNATGDAQGAAQSAIARAAALSQPQGFSPIGNLFADFTSALGTQAAAERAFAYGGGPRPTYNTGLFAPRPGSVVVG